MLAKHQRGTTLVPQEWKRFLCFDPAQLEKCPSPKWESWLSIATSVIESNSTDDIESPGTSEFTNP